MTTGGSDERFDGREEPTEPGASIIVEALRDSGLSLNEVTRDIGETTRIFARLEGHERIAAIQRLAKKMGELGDLAHEARQALEAIAQDGLVF